jgi:3-hydroxyisobutyrate dehydrogenase-like beta-hydroxyacid dehydrogenase
MTKTKIAFLGLGAMGARMATKLVSEDTDVKVWSRSGVPEGFPTLARRWVSTPAGAVGGADLVIAMVTDDHASRSVWIDSRALSAMPRGSIAIECSTLTPAWVGKLSEHARESGVAFVDAPVVGSRPQADAGNLIFLAGGESSAIDAVRSTLCAWGARSTISARPQQEPSRSW